MGLGDIDLTDLALFADGFPDDAFAQLAPRRRRCGGTSPRATPPTASGFWVVSRHAEMQAIGVRRRDVLLRAGPGRARRRHAHRGPALRLRGGGAAQHDGRPPPPPHPPPGHPGGGAAALALLEGELRARTAAILDAVAARGWCDFLVDVAVELPLQAIAMLMGVPDEDRHDLMAWTNATLTYDDRELGTRSAGSEQAAAAMAAYGTALIERKRVEGGDDIVATVARAAIEGDDGGPEPLSDLELLMFFNLLIAAGSETTRNAIALGMAALIEHPEQWELLRRDPSVRPGAVEEILRWSSPTLYNRRTATRDVEVAGQKIRAGDKVTLWWASANRDEEVFDDPFRFDVRREPQPPPRLRPSQPLLPGGQPGPPRDPHHARGAPGPLRPAVARRRPSSGSAPTSTPGSSTCS